MVCLALGFLMTCASSSTTRRQSRLADPVKAQQRRIARHDEIGRRRAARRSSRAIRPPAGRRDGRSVFSAPARTAPLPSAQLASSDAGATRRLGVFCAAPSSAGRASAAAPGPEWSCRGPCRRRGRRRDLVGSERRAIARPSADRAAASPSRRRPDRRWPSLPGCGISRAPRRARGRLAHAPIARSARRRPAPPMSAPASRRMACAKRHALLFRQPLDRLKFVERRAQALGIDLDPFAAQQREAVRSRREVRRFPRSVSASPSRLTSTRKSSRRPRRERTAMSSPRSPRPLGGSAGSCAKLAGMRMTRPACSIASTSRRKRTASCGVQRRG